MKNPCMHLVAVRSSARRFLADLAIGCSEPLENYGRTVVGTCLETDKKYGVFETQFRTTTDRRGRRASVFWRRV